MSIRCKDCGVLIWSISRNRCHTCQRARDDEEIRESVRRSTTRYEVVKQRNFSPRDAADDVVDAFDSAAQVATAYHSSSWHTDTTPSYTPSSSYSCSDSGGSFSCGD